MENEDYKIGDILAVGNNLVYLQYHFRENKYGVTFSQKETPLNLIGRINSYCLGDGIIDNVAKYQKLDRREHLEKFGLSFFNSHPRRSLLKRLFSLSFN